MYVPAFKTRVANKMQILETGLTGGYSYSLS